MGHEGERRSGNGSIGTGRCRVGSGIRESKVANGEGEELAGGRLNRTDAQNVLANPADLA